jgi:hypothetical protein
VGGQPAARTDMVTGGEERMANRAGAPRRPDPLRWLWYALSGRLPIRYREWVLYDLTCPSWPLRHLAPLVVPLVPTVVLLIAVLPGPLSIRATAVMMGAVVGLLLTFGFLEDSTDRRATKFGYPIGTTQAIREQRARDKRARAATTNPGHRGIPRP